MNKDNSPVNINQGHNYHANDNAPNEHTLQPNHTYNTKNTPLSNNAQQDLQNPLYPQSTPTELQHTANNSNETTSSLFRHFAAFRSLFVGFLRNFRALSVLIIITHVCGR